MSKKILLGTLTVTKSKHRKPAKKAKAKKPAVKKSLPKKVKPILFDYKSLSSDILEKRTKEDLSFRMIEKSHGIPPHILHSIESGKMVPSCRNFAMVLTWLGRTANVYFVTVLKTRKTK